jgi:hypothetical protein
MTRFRVGIALVLVALTAGCTDLLSTLANRAPTVDAPPGTKVVSLTWSGDVVSVDLRPMQDGDVPENWHFSRSPRLSFLKRTIGIRESRETFPQPIILDAARLRRQVRREHPAQEPRGRLSFLFTERDPAVQGSLEP